MNIHWSTNYSFKKELNFGSNKFILAISLFLLIFVIGFMSNILAVMFLVKGYTNLAEKFFKITKPIASVTSFVFFQKLPLLEFWKESILLGEEASSALEQAKTQPEPVVWLVNQYDPQYLFLHANKLLASGEKSILVSKFLEKENLEPDKIRDFLSLLAVINQEKNNHKKYLLIFQNSDELRATGGFMGSYAVLDFANPDFMRLEVRDIYDPSGISASKDSPLGHDLYLSEGKGLLLHDANWNPEFASSATDILWFFERIKSDSQSYDGVIAINFSTLEKIVSWLGEVYLPDEKEFVDAQDLFRLLREDRVDFFPGSKQKEHQLASLQTALLLKIESLDKQDLALFATKFLSNHPWDEVQFFAKDELVEQQYTALSLSGDLYSYNSDEYYIFPVESNVGINKANRWVKRNIDFVKDGSLLRTKVSFTNEATLQDRPTLDGKNEAYKAADHLGYISYHRFLTSTNLDLVSVQIGNEVLTNWDKSIVVGQNGLSYYQYGFLITIPEASTKELTADFVLATAPAKLELTLQKQAGLYYKNKLPDRFLVEEVE